MDPKGLQVWIGLGGGSGPKIDVMTTLNPVLGPSLAEATASALSRILLDFLWQTNEAIVFNMVHAGAFEVAMPSQAGKGCQQVTFRGTFLLLLGN